MEFLTILIVLLAIWFLGPWIWKLFVRYILVPYATKKFSQAFGANFNTTSGPRANSRHSDPQPQPRKKKIDPNVGEYVAFEEMTATESTTTSSNGTRTYKATSQIEDAVWEEIK